MATPDHPVTEVHDTFRPHARITGLQFEGGELRVSLDDVAAPPVQPERVRSLHGARIRHDSYSLSVGGNVIEPGLDDSTVVDMVHREHDPVVLAMRIEGVKEIWYLQAEAFNYRKTLGSEAGYTSKENLDKLVHLLSAQLPDAHRDTFIEAWLDKRPLPPPQLSLFDFFKSL